MSQPCCGNAGCDCSVETPAGVIRWGIAIFFTGLWILCFLGTLVEYGKCRLCEVATGQCTPFNNLAWETWGPIPLGFYMPLGQAEICNQNGCFKWDATTDVDEFEVKGCSRGLLELMNWMILFAFIISFVPCCVMCCCAARPDSDDDVRSPRSLGSPRMYPAGGRAPPVYIFNYPRSSAPSTPRSPARSPRRANESRSAKLPKAEGKESKSKAKESKSKDKESKSKELTKGKDSKSKDLANESPKSSKSSGVYFFD